MKKNFLQFLLFAVALPVFVQAQDKKKVIGSGKVVTREVSISSFDKLEASGLFNLEISQGDKESLKIEADDNFQDLFEIKNEAGKLLIGMKKGVNIDMDHDDSRMRIYVTVKNLRSLDLQMVGNTRSKTLLKLNELKVENHSVGNIDLQLDVKTLHMENQSVGNVKLKGKAEAAVFDNNSVGNLQAGELEAGKVEVENNGMGSVEVNAVRELKVSNSLLGRVKNKGKAVPRSNGKVVI